MDRPLPFDLMEAKLTPPVLRAGTVVKTAAIDRIRASPARVVSVVAPAGFGKTTLLAHLAAREAGSFAVVALDERDNDPVVLLRYVAAALHRVHPVPAAVFEALSTPGRSLWSTCTPRVCSALAGVKDRIVLAFDDLHLVTDTASLDVIAALLDHVPEGSRIVIASREEPALGLARLRVQGRLLELGADALRLDGPEAATLLRGAGVDLDGTELDTLVERTEGWPAGLYLAALSLQAGGSGTWTFRGDDRFVADYLRLELLSRLTADDLRFLTRTSVLERLCGGLCDAILERGDSARVLEELERTNRFLVPLDRTRRWYRYHHLFHDLLRSELEQNEPALVPQLHRRAMAWCEANNLPEVALRHAREAGDMDAVTRLVEALALPTYYSGGAATLEQWLGWYDGEQRERHPTIAVIGAWYYALNGRAGEAVRWERAAAASAATPQLPDGSPSITAWIAALRGFSCPDGIEQMLADAELALGTLGPEGWWRPSAQMAVGAARMLLGDPQAAVPALELAAQLATAAGASDEAGVAFGELAFLAIEAGSWEVAAGLAERGVAIVTEARLDDYLAGAIPRAAAARVAIHRGDVARAREEAARIHRIRPLLSHAFPWISVQIGLELTRIHLGLGEPGVAATVLSETEGILRVRPRLGTLVDTARELQLRVASAATPSGEWALSLTAAELRLLPLLTTHLAFPQIGERLFLSRTTIKTQAISIYRKFGVSSRAEAIERAVALGLLEDSVYPARGVPASSSWDEAGSSQAE